MNRRRIAVPALLAAALAISPTSMVVPSASAAGSQIRVPVTFTLTPARCPNLQVTVSGIGERFTVINERMDDNGVDHLEINDLVNGTATDSEGARYVFNYHNHASVDVPPGGFPQELFLTDMFNLNGQGKANQVHVGSVAHVTLTGPFSPPIIQLVNLRGNPEACDAF